MNKNYIILIILLVIVIFPIFAKDQIYLKNDFMIVADIIDVTQTEIKYKGYEKLGRHSQNLGGAISSISTFDVKYIRYDNGSYEFFNNNEPIVPLKIGINANAGGFIPLGDTLKPGGPSLNIEFIKNNFYSIINLSIPIQDNVGFGFSGILNYLWKSKIGDFYLGGGLGYTYHMEHYFTFGANVGYRYVTSFGMYFSVGAYVGGKVNDNIMLDLKPVLGVGYVFK